MTLPPINGRALLVHGGALGDFVLALRIVAALRSAGADGVSLLGRPAYSDLARFAGIERFIDVETGGLHALFRDDLPLPDEAAARLAGHSPVVDMVGGGHVFERRLSAATGGRVVSIDPRPRPGSTAHITDQWLCDLRAAGISTDNVGSPRIDLPRGQRQDTIVVHPGSGGRAKCWPLDRFLELVDGLASDGRDVRFVIGPAELERWPDRDIARLGDAAPVWRHERLLDLADFLTAAVHFVGNDCGVTHLAAAVGTAATAIFGPTDPRIWRPLGEQVAVLGGGNWPDSAAVLAAVRGQLDAPIARG